MIPTFDLNLVMLNC